ncbi:hypothetical protein K440DRAFT_665407 [Wilcoxina mikolae CBS 423.85]|nr:hypothetical protein K440DRAFT_665407 [Wilcoxina mikolae CBS 423.85]
MDMDCFWLNELGKAALQNIFLYITGSYNTNGQRTELAANTLTKNLRFITFEYGNRPWPQVLPRQMYSSLVGVNRPIPPPWVARDVSNDIHFYTEDALGGGMPDESVTVESSEYQDIGDGSEERPFTKVSSPPICSLDSIEAGDAPVFGEQPSWYENEVSKAYGSLNVYGKYTLFTAQLDSEVARMENLAYDIDFKIKEFKKLKEHVAVKMKELRAREEYVKNKFRKSQVLEAELKVVEQEYKDRKNSSRRPHAGIGNGVFLPGGGLTGYGRSRDDSNTEASALGGDIKPELTSTV